MGIKNEENCDLTLEEYQAQKLQDELTYYDKENKTWFTSLLFKETPPNLGTNRQKAIAIMKKVEVSTIQKGRMKEVNDAYDEFVSKGFAEQVFEDFEPEGVHYLPGHAVFREDSQTMKTRIVFNASAISETGQSLNNCLYQGPCLLPDIVHVLIRFRMRIVAFALDISRMFLRVKLNDGKDQLRYFWRSCNPDSEITTFRMKSLTFGVISSPFQAIDVVLKHIELFGQLYPKAVQVIRDQLYMDDVLGGADSLEAAKVTVEEIWKFFLEASMQPHKFASTVPEALECVPEEFMSTEEVHKVLGVLWDTKKDELLLNIKKKEETDEKMDTKRSFLEFSARLFDPLGLVAPFTTKVKLLFQEVWMAEQSTLKKSKSWDEPLPSEIQKKWLEIKEDIPNLGQIAVPRCPFVQQGPPEEVEIFAFGDASKKAYATAIYLVGIHKDGQKSSHLTFAKSRVSPLKMAKMGNDPQTIVRLELLSALITARAATFVRKGLEKTWTVKRICLFTDSLINLCRIKNGPEKYKLWVANRIKEILNLTRSVDWHHCPGQINPADLPSRGLTADELKNSALWWDGPEFIKKNESEWPTEAEIQINNDPEQKKNIENFEIFEKMGFVAVESNKRITHKPNFDFVLTLVNRFEDWHKTVKFVSCILRMSSKRHREEFGKKEYSVEEKKATEKCLWRLSQLKHFESDFKSLVSGQKLPENSKLVTYNPFYDEEDGLLKAHTRLVLSNLPECTRTPVILPKDCPIVMKFVMHKHKQHNHAKAGYLHGLLKNEFLIQRGKQQIGKAIWPCVQKFCHKPMNLGQQEAPLPSLRTDDPAPFQSIGVDLFGPMLVFHACGLPNCPHPDEKKVYGALFTCFHSRAIHLELVDSTGTEAFLNAFRCLVARRGTPSTMYSDNAKGFKAASKELRALYRSINWTSVKNDGLKKNVEWLFSIEKAPHQNGLCERLVRTVKTPLRIVVGSARLTRAQLTIILTEIEAVVNNRPLAVTTDDPNDWVPISPAELVNGRRMEQLPDPRAPKRATSFAHLWKRRQAILNQFWKRWTNDYLLEQSVRKIWQSRKEIDIMGKIVLIKDDNLSRNEWKIGRIIEILPSKDGLVRNVVVKTPTSTLRRAVQKLAFFEQI